VEGKDERRDAAILQQNLMPSGTFIQGLGSENYVDDDEDEVK
jgi:hypothetical protein